MVIVLSKALCRCSGPVASRALLHFSERLFKDLVNVQCRRRSQHIAHRLAQVLYGYSFTYTTFAPPPKNKPAILSRICSWLISSMRYRSLWETKGGETVVSLDIHDDSSLQLRQIARLEKRLYEEKKQVRCSLSRLFLNE